MNIEAFKAREYAAWREIRRQIVNPSTWVAVVVIMACAFILTACAPDRPVQPSAVVKVMVGKGHGSGVSLGNGIVITARHVVGDMKTVTLKSAAGDIQPAEVLWVSEKYDIAYLKASRPARLGSSPLSCREPMLGDTIEIRGNPLGMEFVSVWGHVAGGSRTVGPWASVTVSDITVVPGQSGGPVFDASGNVVGIVVGVMVVPLGFGGSLAGIGYFVPGKAVCDLIGRVA